jgi:uncharacterized iron-regulated membrane protein
VKSASSSTSFLWLERVTAMVLVLVILAVGWMMVAEELPGWLRLPTVEAEIVAVVGLLSVALALVSGLAFLHTRDKGT